jgi:hypothetical protein
MRTRTKSHCKITLFPLSAFSRVCTVHASATSTSAETTSFSPSGAHADQALQKKVQKTVFVSLFIVFY